MKYNYCGRSGLQLPAISLGLWHNFGDVDTYANSEAIVKKAFDLGITHFDIADNYGPPPGSAERNFGRMLRECLKGHRDEIVITSKAGHLMWDGPYGDGGSRKHIMAGIDQSLQRTGLDYFDIFYSHRHTPDTPWEETIQALIDIVKQGKALYIGLSKYPVGIARQAVEMMRSQHTPCIVYQDRYSMLVRKPEAEHQPMVEDLGLGFVAFSPLAQGLLTNRYLNGIPSGSRATKSQFLHSEDITPELVAKLRALNDIAAARGQTLAQMALSWVLSRKGVTSVIVGASSPAQLADTAAAADFVPFTPSQLAAIDSLLAPATL